MNERTNDTGHWRTVSNLYELELKLKLCLLRLLPRHLVTFCPAVILAVVLDVVADSVDRQRKNKIKKAGA